MSSLAIGIIYPLFSLLIFLLPVLNFTFFVKPNKKILFIYSLIIYVLYGCLLLNHINNVLVLVPIILFIYLLIIYKKVGLSIVLTGLIWILISISDTITGAVFIYFLKYDINEITNYSLLDLQSQLFFNFTIFILSKLIRLILLKIFKKIDIKFEIPKKLPIIFLFSVILSIFAIYQTVAYTNLKSLDSSMIAYNAIMLLIFFIFIVVIIHYSFTILINKHKANEYLQLKDYTNMIENMYSDLRSFRHDYLNILSTLETYIEKQDINGLKIFYYNELLPESNIIIKKDISLSLLSHIKISPLKALLSSKFTTAHSHGIKVSIELIDDIEHVNMSTIDICRIIGILLDNAIEASVLCDNKFIHFAMVKTDNQTILNISNSCLSSTPPIHKLYTKNFSTKGENRGIGLNNIKDIINKRYNNVLFNTSIDNCVFKQELIINNK